MFGLGALVFRTTIIKVIGKGDSNYILLTLGISYLLQYGMQLALGPNFQNLSVTNEFRQSAIHLGEDLTVMLPQFTAFSVALVFVIGMSYFLSKTDMGRAMRATSEDRTVASMLGVNTKLIYTIAFSLGTVFAGISGLLLSPIYSIHPRSGVLFSTIAMAVVVLGGLGNIKGAMIGGLMIGLVQSLFGTFVNMDIAQIAVDTVLIAMLMFKPFGLFGGGARKA
jgi:branched-chain amino acid transport system permease protein